MRKVTIFVDNKVTVWERETHEVTLKEDETIEEYMQKRFDENYDESFQYSEMMTDTCVPLSPEDNGGEPTKEVFNEDMESVYSNI